MKTSALVLLVIGLLGTAAALYGMIQSQSISENLVTLVCGLSLLYGYFELKRQPSSEP